jgi:hypothetical protein
MKIYVMMITYVPYAGSIPIAEYIKALTVGFGTIEIRGRRPTEFRY